MPNIKYQYSERLLALHEEWAVKNGYRDKPQAASAKLQAASDKLQKMLKTLNDSLKAPSHKLQASSVKRPTVRQATSVERGPNHCV
jgi:Skp family chaperone for outer membrane proteins